MTQVNNAVTAQSVNQAQREAPIGFSPCRGRGTIVELGIGKTPSRRHSIEKLTFLLTTACYLFFSVDLSRL